METGKNLSWGRFKKNKFAVAGLLIISIIVIVCSLGYLITPDDSPMANRMNLQLNIEKPGSSFSFIRLETRPKSQKVNIIHKLIFGQPSQYNDVPIIAYGFKGQFLYYRKYLGPDEAGDWQKIAIKTFGDKSREEIREEHIVTKHYVMGTDMYGRDLFSRIIIGARLSMLIGLMAVIISLTLGIFLGATAGYFGGRTDSVISWLMNVVWSLPTLLLVIAISFALGKGFWQVFIAVGFSMWVEVARLVRGQVLAFKQTQFVEAARSLGYSNLRIIYIHILPNIIGPILVLAASNFASAILLEAGLSFLGFGAQPPMPTWGGMIKEHYAYIVMDAAFLAIIPGFMIMLVVYAFNLVTIGLRDVLDLKDTPSSV